MAPPKTQPSLDVIIERLAQNTELTKDIQKQVISGFKSVNSRVSATERRLDKLEWQRENEHEELERAREEAKEVIADAATNVVDKPKVGSVGWMLVTLVAIIMALIVAMK